jgi:menaquinone-9 beta-reductase
VDRCDALIVGGGPAGSSCARALARAGLDVVVLDKARFPRDKVCAGWITPQVVDDLELDAADYRCGRTYQAITSFRVGIVGRERGVDVHYRSPVSYGIRRCEFDEYLLRRSGARLILGEPVATLRRDGSRWIVNDHLAAPMLVGAGGHFCPVARTLAGAIDRTQVVAAREVEFAVETGGPSSVAGERPELYFCPDLTGYGWCFRKEAYLNVGFGQLDARALPAATDDFVAFLRRAGRIASSSLPRWKGHAYLLAGPARRAAGNGHILIGDAAGLAYPESGEGIRPAIESGLMAAAVILEARGRYTADRLAAYEHRLRNRFAPSSAGRALSQLLPNDAVLSLGRRLLDRRWFVRHLVLDRWFLHSHHQRLAA